MYKNFNNWSIYDGFSEGSGTSDQEWIVNKETNEIGLFKFPKSLQTTDHVSEKIASDIAKLVNLECANIDLGTYKDRMGMISYKINPEGVDLIEGISILSSRYAKYDSDVLKDTETGECYSLNMIMNSLKEYNLEKEFLKVTIFDFLIGNSDRHDRNWAILRKDKNVRLCPVYDNASSLCSYLNEDSLADFFKDDNRFKALVDSKSRSLIRIDRLVLGRKGPKHSDVIKHVRDNYYEDTIAFVHNIKDVLTEKAIEDLITNYKDYLGSNKTKLLIKYLKAKLTILFEIYDIRL